MTAASGAWVYDGSAHTVDSCTAVGLTDGDRIESVVYESGTDSITDAGEKQARIDSVSIVDSQGNPVEGKYDITYVPGVLSIEKAVLILTAESDSKVYDGKALVNRNVSSSSKLANSRQQISVRYKVVDQDGNVTKAVKPGTYIKRITNVSVMEGDRDVSANYDIRLVDGTLTVLPDPNADTASDGGGDTPDKNASTAGVPLTGDESRLGLWTALLGVSAAVLVAAAVLLILRKRRK